MEIKVSPDQRQADYIRFKGDEWNLTDEGVVVQFIEEAMKTDDVFLKTFATQYRRPEAKNVTGIGTITGPTAHNDVVANKNGSNRQTRGRSRS